MTTFMNPFRRFKFNSHKAGVKRFLGMLKYVARFIPNLSKLTANLRQLTMNNVVFRWGNGQEREFQLLKELIATDRVLGIFDP